MDDGTPIDLQLSITDDGSATFDFSDSGKQVAGNWNAPPAVTHSAVLYCLRCMLKEDIPLNHGCMAPIQVMIKEGSILSPTESAAVVAGNVLTSQRVVDVILKAFGASAASQGCMNNLTFGNESFGYYETIGGGAGAGPDWHGQSGVHTHMTNTRITDPEILEKRYPVLLKRFAIRKGSGGEGLFNGGDGLIREIEFQKPLTVAIISDRRIYSPYGYDGGCQGEKGKNIFIKNDGTKRDFGGKNMTQTQKGDRILIMTPGGGGYGPVKK
jgi:5-oxoprolinase (ATP-hydrolysing)